MDTTPLWPSLVRLHFRAHQHECSSYGAPQRADKPVPMIRFILCCNIPEDGRIHDVFRQHTVMTRDCFKARRAKKLAHYKDIRTFCTFCKVRNALFTEHISYNCNVKGLMLKQNTKEFYILYKKDSHIFSYLIKNFYLFLKSTNCNEFIRFYGQVKYFC